MHHKTFFFLICGTIFLFFIECKVKKEKENHLIQIDVSVSYPWKEIYLEEIADIEYLQIEFNDEFLFNEPPESITDDKMMIHQLNGDVFVFSRAGKPLLKFNHTGNGPGEYASITGKCIYDETRDEIYVRTFNKLMVYSLSGQFSREIPLLESEGAFISIIVNYDSEMLLLHDDNNVYPAPFTLISKQDGSVVETVNMPEFKKSDLSVFVAESESGARFSFKPPLTNILRYNGGYLLSDFSNDTIYFFSREKELLPMLVRKPKVHSMNPIITLHGFVEGGSYDFFFTTKVQLENGRLPRKYLMRDQQTGAVYMPKISLNDYKGKLVEISPFTILNSSNSKLGFILLSLFELKEANCENRLSGRLKELVDNSDEDGNDIYMFIHFK